MLTTLRAIDTTDTPPTHSALGKALQVLEVFLQDGAPLPLAELARRLDLPRQTVHRLVRQLVEEGLLQRDLEKDSYAVGPRLMGLATDTIRAAWQPGPLRAILASLVAEIEETCNLGVLDGDRVRYVDRVECNWPIRAQLSAGDQVPIHATAIGKLLLAYLPSRPRKRLLAAISMPSLARNTITTTERMEAELLSVRKLGYAMNNEENADGLVGIAVPILDDARRAVAGLALHAPTSRVAHADLPRFVDPLRRAAGRIEEQIGLMRGN